MLLSYSTFPTTFVRDCSSMMDARVGTYVVAEFYISANFYFLSLQPDQHTLPYPKTIGKQKLSESKN